MSAQQKRQRQQEFMDMEEYGSWQGRPFTAVCYGPAAQKEDGQWSAAGKQWTATIVRFRGR
eukprot:9263632-Lingulodinium_polyedra.AAC.1